MIMLSDVVTFLNEYDYSEHEIKFISVRNDTISELFDLLNTLHNLVYEENSEELEKYFKSLQLLFNRVKNSLNSYQETFQNEVSQEMRIDINNFFNLLMTYNNSDEVKEIFKRMSLSLSNLKKGNIENTLFKEVSKIIQKEKDFETIAIVSYYAERIDVGKFENKKIVYLTPAMLVQRTNSYSKIIYIGTSNLYPESETIFFGKKIYYVGYDFYKNGFNREPIINGNDEEQSGIYRNVIFSEVSSSTVNNNRLVIDKIEHPIESKQSFDSWVVGYKKSVSTEDGLKEGYLFSLKSGGKVIFPTNGKCDVLDIESMVTTETQIGQIDDGSIIVLRISTENEYLSSKAYEEYGEYYSEKIQLIKKYKDKLLLLKNCLGTYEKLKKFLENNEIEVSSVVVLRTWTTMDVLRPRSTEKFSKLLSLLDLDESQIAETIKAIDFVNKVHRKIGRDLSKKTQEIVAMIYQNELYNALQSDGYYSFEEPGIGEFRIEVLEEKYSEVIQVINTDYYRILTNYE